MAAPRKRSRQPQDIDPDARATAIRRENPSGQRTSLSTACSLGNGSKNEHNLQKNPPSSTGSPSAPSGDPPSSFRVTAPPPSLQHLLQTASNSRTANTSHPLRAPQASAPRPGRQLPRQSASHSTSDPSHPPRAPQVSAPQPGRIAAADNLSSSDLSEIPETDDDGQRVRKVEPPPRHKKRQAEESRAPHVPPAKMLKSNRLEESTCATDTEDISVESLDIWRRELVALREKVASANPPISTARASPSFPNLGMKVKNAAPPAPNCATNASHQPRRKLRKPAPLRNLGRDTTASSGQKNLVPHHDASLSIRQGYASFESFGGNTEPSPAPSMSALDRDTSHVPPANKITLRVPPAARSRELEANLNGSPAPGRTSAPGKPTAPIPPANKATRNMPEAPSTRELEPWPDDERPPAPSRRSARDKASSSIPLSNKITPMMPAVSAPCEMEPTHQATNINQNLRPNAVADMSIASSGQKNLAPHHDASLSIRHTYASFGSSGGDTEPSPAPSVSALDRATSHVPPANKITLHVRSAARSRKLEANLNGSPAPGRTSAPGKPTAPIPPANKATRNMPEAPSTRELEPWPDGEHPPPPSRTSAPDRASNSSPRANNTTSMMPAVSFSSSRQALEPKLDVEDSPAPRRTSASGRSITPAQEANLAVTTTSAAPSSRQTRPHVLNPEREPGPRCLGHASPTPLIDISPLTAIAPPPASRRTLERLVESTLQAGSPLVPTTHDTLHSIHPPIERPLPTSVPLPKSYLISPTLLECHSPQEGPDLILLSPTNYLGQSSPSIQPLSPKQELAETLPNEANLILCLYDPLHQNSFNNHSLENVPMSHEKRLLLLADTPAKENIVPPPVSSDGSTTLADPPPSSRSPPLSANDLPLSAAGFLAQLADIQLIPKAALSAPPGPLEYFPLLRPQSPIRTPIELRYQPLNTRRDPLESSPVFPQPLSLGEIANRTSEGASEVDELDLITFGSSPS